VQDIDHQVLQHAHQQQAADHHSLQLDVQRVQQQNATLQIEKTRDRARIAQLERYITDEARRVQDEASKILANGGGSIGAGDDSAYFE